MNKKQAPQANYATKPITPLIAEFVSWLEEQTGYKPDPLSVMLGSSLRGQFQKSPANQKRLVEVQARLEAEAQARAERKAAREAQATPAPAPAKTPARRRPAKAVSTQAVSE